MQTTIPLLQSVRVASPCDASWEGMESIDGERVKFCLHCSKNVYNLSEMSQSEAEGLLRKHEGKLCVRYYQRRDGTVLTRDCPVGAQAIRMALIRRSTVAAGLFTMLFGAMAVTLLSEETHTTGDVSPVPATVTTGKVAFTPVPPLPPVTPEPPTHMMGAVAVAPRVEMGEVPVTKDVMLHQLGQIALPPPSRAFMGHRARPEQDAGSITSIPDKPYDYDYKAAQDSTDEAILKSQK